MKDSKFIVGVDVGGTHISAAVVSVEAKKILRETYTTSAIDNSTSAETILSSWAKVINTTIAKAPEYDITEVAFAMPGPFDYAKGTALFPSGFKYGALYKYSLKYALPPLLSVKNPVAIRFLNDATSFAVGEAWLSEKEGFKKYVCITLGTGLGAAFVNDGIPVATGETVPPNGCLWNLDFKEGMADDYFSTRGCIDLYKKFTDKDIEGVKELAEMYEADKKVKDVFFAFGELLGEFLTPWLQRFDADVLVMGGNISLAYAYFESGLKGYFEKVKFDIPIKISYHMEDAAIIGCTRVFNADFWNRTKDFLPKL